VSNERSRIRRRSKPVGGEKRELAVGDTQPAFDGTIASACESVCITLEQMIEMMRWAKESDSRVAKFLDAWDALGAAKQEAGMTADAVRQQVGLKLPELLGIVADSAYRSSMYMAQIQASMALPSIVECSIDASLTDDGIADRKMLFQHSGFLPTPKGSQTTINVAQYAQANPRPIVAAPSPGCSTRRLTDELYERLGKPPVLEAKNSEPVPIECSSREGSNGE
jgi:hypothetical protein